MRLDANRLESVLPVTNFERPEEGETNGSDKGAQALSVFKMSIFKVEAARLEGFEERFDLPSAGVSG